MKTFTQGQYVKVTLGHKVVYGYVTKGNDECIFGKYVIVKHDNFVGEAFEANQCEVTEEESVQMKDVFADMAAMGI